MENNPVKDNISIINKLSDNPLFQFSLGSKELFHSNFIAWILNIKAIPEEFKISFLNKLLFNVEHEKRIIEILTKPKREELNFDIQFNVKVTDSSKAEKIIIENKVKSLPNEEQLEAYQKKISKDLKANFYLLSLIRPSQDFNMGEWKYISYSDLAESLRFALPKLNEHNDKVYKINFSMRGIIESYIDFAITLAELSEDIRIKDNPKEEMFDYFTVENTKPYKDERLHDLFLKLKYEQLTQKIEREIKTECTGLYKIEKDPWSSSKAKKKLADTYWIKSGFSRATAIIDFKYIPITFRFQAKDLYLVLGIQLQSNQLRYVVEFIGIKKSEKASELLYRLAASLREQGKWCVSLEELLQGYKAKVIGDIKGKASKSKIGYDPERTFCSYDNSFLYKYNELKSNNSIEDIIAIYLD